jgi:putative lipoprotein
MKLPPSALLLSGLVFACATSTDMSRVTGTVTYRERIAMPRGAVVEMTLEDVARLDAPAEVLGRVTIEDPGNVPIEFAIPYDPAARGG